MLRRNSIGAFSRSNRRASTFREIQPVLRKYVLGQDEDTSSGREQSRHSDTLAAQNEQTPLLSKTNDVSYDTESGLPLLRSTLNNRAYERVECMNREREECRSKQKEDQRDALVVRKVQRADGTEAEVVIGQSTLPQTVFNASNVLIGVGMLSLPLGVRYAGWICGIIMLVFSAFATKYTAHLLAKCLDIHSSLTNFADIAYVAFGEKGRHTTSVIFTFELTAACISLVILFADSLESLIEGPDAVHWKIFAGCVLAPLNFLPMSWLSYSSFLGIFCGILLIIVTFVAGFLKTSSPGSLLEVATTYALPQHWKALPLSFGLLMAVWGGHSVFPNIYRDMRHPQKYSRSLNITFSFVTTVDISMAVIGYLMYGNQTSDEVSKNVLKTVAYPQELRTTILVLIAIIPITKFPLNCAPIVSTLEVLFGIDPSAAISKPNKFNQSRFLTKLLKIIFRLGVTIIIVLLAILVPTFELISAIMGAAFCFLICIIMPVMFHLALFADQMSKRELIVNWILMVMSAVLGVVGTVWEFLPRSWMEL